MKKHSLFSFKLYREGLHQIRVFAIVPLVFMFISLFTNFAGNCIIAAQSGSSSQSVLNSAEMNPLLSFTFFLCAPLLTLVLFQFLNKRNQSDFYHAIPQPRQCVAISFLAAILTWIVIYTVVPTLCGAVLYRFFLSKFMTFDMALLWSGALNTFVLSLLVISAVFLAMTVTGTLFSNGIVALLILFLPRFFMTIINAAFSYDIIPAETLNFPLGPFNMLFNLLFGSFMSSNGGLYPFRGGALLYTAVLALLYLLLGLFLFKRRPSEAAGNPAPSRKIQAFHRIVLTCAVAFPLTLLFVSEPPTSAEDILLYIVGYIVAIVVYFMYELLSTRTVRNMVKIIPGLLIVVVACIAGTLLSKGFYNALLNDIPKTENVDAIYVEDIGDYYSLTETDYFFPDSTPDYFTEKVGELRITDKECLKLTTASLQNTVQKIKSDKSVRTTDGNWAQVKFVTKNGRKITRLIPVTAKEETTLKNAITALPEYKNVYTLLPALKSGYVINAYSNATLTQAQQKEAYNTLREELKTVDADKWIACVNNTADFTQSDFCTIAVSIPKNGKTVTMTLPIGTLTPNTLKLIQKDFYTNFDAEKFKKKMTLPTDLEQLADEDNYWSFSIGLMQDSNYTESVCCSSSVLLDDTTLTAEQKVAAIKRWNAAVDWFADHLSAEFDITKPYVCLSGSYESYRSLDAHYCTDIFFSFDGTALPDDAFGLSDFVEKAEEELIEE